MLCGEGECAGRGAPQQNTRSNRILRLGPPRPPACSGRSFWHWLAVSPDGGLVSATSNDGEILLLDPALRKSIESIRGHLIVAFRSAFSPDGRRLFSTDRRQEAVKLWDVATRQELLTLAGADSGVSTARWSADGNMILVGPPWQAWSAPSWEEIAAAEAKDPPSSDFGGQGKTEIKQP